ncbi:MAG: alpha/beta hydrolase fold domain-containing protein [Bacilli bacterium]|nr:alpha/beta hydrolase fold domain-containing protein [Bacilli bacterium]
MKQNEFELEEKYKLFRTVKDLLHPTISKRNISNYKIIVDEKYLLLRVFYPKKVSNIKDVIFFVPGEGSITECEGLYSDISSFLSKELDQMVISIDYEKTTNDMGQLLDKIYDTLAFIYKQLLKEGVTEEHISLMGDSTGATLVLNNIHKMNEEGIKVGKMILFYPVLSGEYSGKTQYKSILENTSVNYNLVAKLKEFYKNCKKEFFPLTHEDLETYPKTLLLSGNGDPLIDEAKAFAEKNKEVEIKIVDFAYHGFLNTKDKEIQKDYLESLKEFMK